MRIKPIYSLFLLLYSSITIFLQAYIRRCCYQEELFAVFLFFLFLFFFVVVCVFLRVSVYLFSYSMYQLSILQYIKMTNETSTKIINAKFSSSGICSSR